MRLNQQVSKAKNAVKQLPCQSVSTADERVYDFPLKTVCIMCVGDRGCNSLLLFRQLVFLEKNEVVKRIFKAFITTR